MMEIRSVTSYIVKYDYVEDMITKRAPFREDHLGQANKWISEGKLLFIGAYTDSGHEAILIFNSECVSEDNVREYIHQDAYVKNNLVKHWSIRPMKGFCPKYHD